MRLTNQHRQDVVDRAVAATFDPQKEALAKREHELGMKFYEHVIPEVERRAAKKLSKRWIATDSCLRFNANGPNLDFTVREPVAVPANGGYCRPLGALDGALVAEAVAHRDAVSDLRDKRKSAERQLRSLLDSISSLAQLEETWPEGKLFYQHLGSDVRVPVPIVRDVNAALGLAA